jgi:putative SbcD/Mre11-related phosphoesterase
VGKVDEVVLLGDVKHDFGSILKQEREDTIRLINWLLERVGKVIIVKGNHDSILEPILKGKESVELLKSYCFGEVCFIHGDEDSNEIWQKDIKKIVIGHIHPGVSIDDGVKREKYKCFLVGKIRNGLKIRELFIVPSFSEHGGDLDVIRSEVELPSQWKIDLNDFKVKIISEEDLEVLEFGKLEKLRK